MTKQEEVFYILQDVRLGELSEYEATAKLHKLGVVIKKDPSWIKITIDASKLEEVTGFTEAEATILNKIYVEKYVAVEPLIKESENGN